MSNGNKKNTLLSDDFPDYCKNYLLQNNILDNNNTYPKDLIDNFVKSDIDFRDSYQTKEQKNRDTEITKLLRKYVESYSEKVETQKIGRKVLIILCSSIIFLFSIVFLILVLYFSFTFTLVNIENIIGLISVCITFLGSILGLFQIITKYCFPEKDEEYITKIVEAIQKNDLENKKENIKLENNSEDINKIIEALRKVNFDNKKENSNDN